MAAPPQPSASWRTATAGPQTRRHILRYVILTALGVLVAVGVAALIIWLIIKPAPLEYIVDDAKIHDFNLTTDGKLNATFSLRFVSDNRNQKVSVYYDSMLVEVRYDDRTIASKELAPFYQPTRNATRIAAEVVVRGMLLEVPTARNLRHDRSAGRVELQVKVTARIRMKVALIKSKRYTLEAYCTSVIVRFSDEGEFQKAYCEVDI